jgi:hypothetical protein
MKMLAKPIFSKAWKVEDVGQEQGWPVPKSQVLIQFEIRCNMLDKSSGTISIPFDYFISARRCK